MLAETWIECGVSEREDGAFRAVGQFGWQVGEASAASARVLLRRINVSLWARSPKNALSHQPPR